MELPGEPRCEIASKRHHDARTCVRCPRNNPPDHVEGDVRVCLNDHGHMMVAAVAYRQLAPGVRARVDALLKLNPFYQRWLDQLPPALLAFERPAALFMIAATWADQIKRVPEYSDDGSAGGNRPDGPGASLNKGYDDLLRLLADASGTRARGRKYGPNSAVRPRCAAGTVWPVRRRRHAARPAPEVRLAQRVGTSVDR